MLVDVGGYLGSPSNRAKVLELLGLRERAPVGAGG